MQVLGWVFAFLLFMAVVESVGWLSYVYAAFWLAIVGAIAIAVIRIYRIDLRRISLWHLLRPLRNNLNELALKYVPIIKAQYPRLVISRDLGVALTVLGALVFIYILTAPYRGGLTLGWHVVVWALSLVVVPVALWFVGAIVVDWAKNIDSKLSQIRNQEAYQQREQEAVAEVRATIEHLMPPPGPFEVTTADALPPESSAAILAPLSQLQSEWGYLLPGVLPPLRIFDEDEKPPKDPTLLDLIWNKDIIKQLTTSRSAGFTSEQRFTHQFVVGASHSGKTTYLSTQILQDLEAVERGECSLFVMDSQNELIPQIAKLRCFAEGEPLHGKLTYIEPHPLHPLALNIFDLKSHEDLTPEQRASVISGATQMVKFFLASVLEMDTSGHQNTMLEYVIPAVMHIPNATILTLQQLLSDEGRQLVEEHLRDYENYDWLSKRLYSPDQKITRTAIRNRVDGMMANTYFKRMFTQPRNQLDLFNELQGARVILVNTKKALLRDATQPFGRFFIAKLLQATEERMFLPKASRLPVYCYIDEAGDYIRQDANVEELIDKARKQRVSITFAVQAVEHIRTTEVLAALRRCGIQAYDGRPPYWTVSLRGQKPLRVLVPNTQFDELPHIDDEGFDRLRESMWNKYSSSGDVAPVYAPSALPPLLPAPPTREDDLPTSPQPF